MKKKKINYNLITINGKEACNDFKLGYVGQGFESFANAIITYLNDYEEGKEDAKYTLHSIKRAVEFHIDGRMFNDRED